MKRLKKLKRRKKAILPLLGVMLTVALFIGLYKVENSIALIIDEELKKIAVKACECDFQYDRIDVSLLRLKARIDNPRLIKDNVVGLSFHSASTNISLRKIKQKIVSLSNLQLINGHAKNFDNKSILFKFIDEITTPNPHKTSPWRVRVSSLFVINATLTQDLEATRVEARNVSMSLQPLRNGEFELRPFISKLDLIRKKDESVMVPLHSLSSLVTIRNEDIVFGNLAWRTDFSLSDSGELTLHKKSNKLSGFIGYRADVRDMHLPHFFKGKVSGKADVSGFWPEPLLHGSFKSDSKSIPKVSIEEHDIILLDALQGLFNISWKNELPVLNITSLALNHPKARVSSFQTFTVSEERLNGNLSLKAEELSLGSVSAFQSDITFNVRGTIEDNTSTFSSRIANLNFGPFSSPDITLHYTADTRGEKLTLRSDTDNQNGLYLQSSDEESFNGFFTFEADHFPFVLAQELVNPDVAQEIFFVTGKGNFKNIASAKNGAGKATLSIRSSHLLESSNLNANVAFKKGIVDAKIHNDSSSLGIDIRLPFLARQTGIAKVTLNNFEFKEYLPSVECAKLSGVLDYEFAQRKPLKGVGFLELRDAEFACAPYTLSLAKPQKVEVKKGVLSFDKLLLDGDFGEFLADGSISLKKGYNISSEVDLELQTLLNFIPQLDDLRGNANVSLSLKGPLSDPQVKGDIALQEGSFNVESLSLAGENLQGSVSLRKDGLHIDSIKGMLNKGDIEVEGFIDVAERGNTSVRAHIQQMQIEPYPNSYAELSGTLELEANVEQEPEISGLIEVNRGIFEQNINVTSLIDFVTSTFVYDSAEQLTVTTLPTLNLNVNVIGERDFLLLTNFLEAELAADLTVRGTLAKPALRGSVRSLSGWVGFKDKRFDITSGNVFFNPGENTPELDLIAETILDTPTGESILTILEAKGPLLSPQVHFSSDTNITEQELLTLLTLSQRNNFETEVNTIKRTGRGGSVAFIESKKGNILQEFLHSLTSFDSISLEPTVNIRSGLIEPTVIAEKDLANDFILRGETNLSNNSPGSKATVLYNLSPKMQVRAGVDTMTVQDATSVSSDISYTIYAKKKDFLKIDLRGSLAFSESRFLKKIRISSASRIDVASLDNLQQSVNEMYSNEGYPNAEVNISCERSEIHQQKLLCRHITFSIQSNAPCKITSIALSSTTTLKDVNINPLLTFNKKQIASTEFKATITQSILAALRNEGYIKARIQSHYNQNNKGCDIRIELDPGSPVTFVFKGNTVFSPKDFLNTINLFERIQPFGNNTINILVQRMEKLYRDRGYLFATIKWQLHNIEHSNRQQYIISIEEGDVISVKNVKLQGLISFSEQDIKKYVKKKHTRNYEEFFNPRFARAEAIFTNVSILRDMLKIEGFPRAHVASDLAFNEANNGVDIIYNISEGDPLKGDWLHIENWPAYIKLPKEPEAPYSIPKANTYIEKLISVLEKNGFVNVSFSSYIAENKSFVINFNPGFRAHIRKIYIRGNDEITSKLVFDTIHIKDGSAWSDSRIRKSQRALLSLGLFSRVSIQPLDGKVDKPEEDVIIELIERPLQSLQFGGGLHSELGLHLFGEATNKSWFADGRSVSFRADLYYEAENNNISQGLASISLKQPNVFDNAFDLNHSLRFQKIDLTTFEFDLDRYIFDTALQNKVNQHWRFNIGYSFINENLDNVPDDVVLSSNDTGTTLLSLVTFSSYFDKRNNPINPSRGFQLFLESTLASEVFGSDASYVTLGSSFSYLLPLSSRFYIAEKITGNAGWTLDGGGLSSYFPTLLCRREELISEDLEKTLLGREEQKDM